MRLISAEINGYGRLVSSKVNLDSKVIAIVGPNEAGKTTLLKALAYLNGNTVLSTIERSRFKEIGDNVEVVKVKFALEEEDKVLIQGLELREPPLTVFVSRRASGTNVEFEIIPHPKNSKRSLQEAVEALIHEADHNISDLDKYQYENSRINDADEPSSGNALEDLRALIADIQSIVSDSNDKPEDWLRIAGRTRDLSALLAEDPVADELVSALDQVKAWTEMPDPDEEVRTILWGRTPKFLLFSEEDRTLESSYVFDEELVKNASSALANLLRMAGLNLGALESLSRAGDVARRDTELNRVNKRLSELFASAWKQSPLSVRLSVDGAELRVSVLENGEAVTPFSERSAGLRMFIALIAFLAARESTIPPILLIDEAENHLHIDAQADLVNMFMSQDKAARVIYTTHSPACLPPDLGVGVRSIAPSLKDLQVSEIRNSFWTYGPGYSPLITAMGAAAAAFALARFVVLGEGATEMILLPSLLRSVTGLSSLEFQVAPGLASVRKDFYPKLDFEGARVAYLVDGDESGKNMVQDLILSGVPRSRIVMTTVPGLENVLPADVYRDVITVLLHESNPKMKGLLVPQLAAPKDSSWAKQMQQWCESNGLAMPSKVAVACRLIEDGSAVPSEDFRDELLEVYEQLARALELKAAK